MTKASRAERMRRLLLEDSKDDSSSAGSNERERDTPFDFPSMNVATNESKEEQDNSFASIPFTVGIDESFGFEVDNEQQPFPAAMMSKEEEVVDLESLKHHLKHSSKVKSIVAHAKPDTINGWIKVVEEAHAITINESDVNEREMPTVEELMQPWPDEMNDALASGEVKIPPPTIDLSLEDYARTLCLLLGVPIKERLIDSVHELMLLYAELNEKESDTHSEIAVTVDEWD